MPATSPAATLAAIDEAPTPDAMRWSPGEGPRAAVFAPYGVCRVCGVVLCSWEADHEVCPPTPIFDAVPNGIHRPCEARAQSAGDQR